MTEHSCCAPGRDGRARARPSPSPRRLVVADRGPHRRDGLAPGRRVHDGQSGRAPITWRTALNSRPAEVVAVSHRSPRRDQRALRGVRRGHRLHHRRRALRLVLRLRGSAPGRPPGRLAPSPGALVAAGRGRRLAPPRGPASDIDERDHPVVHVCWHDARLLHVGGRAAAHRGRVGVRRARRAGAAARSRGATSSSPAASTG